MSAGTLAAAAAMALGVPTGAHAAASVPQIQISGSNTALPLVADLAFFYRRTVKHPPRFTLVGGGTQAGIVDAARGITDLGIASRGEEPGDPDNAVFTRFARSAVCLVTPKANPVPGFTHDQIQSLVSAQATSWSQIPGSPRGDEIVGAGLPLGTGERAEFLRTFLDVDTPFAYTPRTLSNSGQLRRFVAATPNAWAYIDFAFTEGLHVVPYQGVGCTREHIIDGTYAGTTDVTFVTSGAPKGAVARFITWTRTSRVAIELVGRRYVPVK